ncbi:solute carrier family 49 member 4-like [Centruroides vittatus]|uniref:solute carrier family 49 member 4-like n=1 Tax=Centruroides vittatus TaxID=120091 RepID=UPI0035101EE5
MTPTPKELLAQKDDENQKLLPCSTPVNYNSIGINTESSIVNVQSKSLAWITWSTIPESAKAIFGWNDGTLALLADWGNIPFVILGIPICWFLNKRGLRLSVVLTSVLIFVATGLRCISHKTEIATPLIHVAQILNGIAGVIVTGAPSLLSSIWFPTKQRTTATSISILCNYMGVCFGFLLGPVILDTSGLPPCYNETWGNLTHGCKNYTSEQLKTFVHNHTQRIMCLMYFECILAALVLLLICIYFPGKPPLPPTASAHLDRLDFITSFKLLRKNTNFWIISLGYAITNSTFANWISMLGVALESLNITQNESSRMATFATLIGCILSLFMARIVDLVGGYIKLTLVILWTIGCANCIVYSLVYQHYLPASLEILYPVVIIVGVLSYSPGPLYMELTSEVTYPISEGTIGVTLQTLVNFFGSIFLAIFLIPNIGTNWMNWCLIGATVIGVVLAILQKESYQRSNFDKTALKFAEDSDNSVASA